MGKEVEIVICWELGWYEEGEKAQIITHAILSYRGTFDFLPREGENLIIPEVSDVVGCNTFAVSSVRHNLLQGAAEIHAERKDVFSRGKNPKEIKTRHLYFVKEFEEKIRRAERAGIRLIHMEKMFHKYHASISSRI